MVKLEYSNLDEEFEILAKEKKIEVDDDFEFGESPFNEAGEEDEDEVEEIDSEDEEDQWLMGDGEEEEVEKISTTLTGLFGGWKGLENTSIEETATERPLERYTQPVAKEPIIQK